MGLISDTSTGSDAYLKSDPHCLVCRLKEVHIPRLITPAEKGWDLEPRVMDAYIIQCQAEAQEGSHSFSFQLLQVKAWSVCA